MITKLSNAINSCEISFKIYIEKEGIEFASLVGNDKNKMLNKLPCKMSSYQSPDYYKTVEKIWKVATYIARF